jgi:hypothetical protein
MSDDVERRSFVLLLSACHEDSFRKGREDVLRDGHWQLALLHQRSEWIEARFFTDPVLENCGGLHVPKVDNFCLA